MILNKILRKNISGIPFLIFIVSVLFSCHIRIPLIITKIFLSDKVNRLFLYNPSFLFFRPRLNIPIFLPILG